MKWFANKLNQLHGLKQSSQSPVKSSTSVLPSKLYAELKFQSESQAKYKVFVQLFKIGGWLLQDKLLTCSDLLFT
jgi:hypothetical protein